MPLMHNEFEKNGLSGPVHGAVGVQSAILGWRIMVKRVSSIIVGIFESAYVREIYVPFMDGERVVPIALGGV